MAVQHLSSIDLRGPALLLGPGGDLDLVTAATGPGDRDPAVPVALLVGGDDTGDLLGDRLGPTVVLVHLTASAVDHPAVIEAVGQGVAAVVAGPVDEAVAAAADLVAAGADPTRLAVEVTVGPGPVGDTIERFLDAAAASRAAAGTGGGTGADATPPRPAVALDPPTGTDEERAAWEIGVLTRVLSGPHPARTVRGADPARFRRVREVVAAVDGGGAS